MNNFQKLIREREKLLPEEVEYSVMTQANTMGHFGNIVSLFVINTMATVVHFVTGGEDPKCLRDSRERIAAEMEEYRWKHPPIPGTEPFPDALDNRPWTRHAG